MHDNCAGRLDRIARNGLIRFIVISTLGTGLFLAVVVTIGTGARSAIDRKQIVQNAKAEILQLMEERRKELCDD